MVPLELGLNVPINPPVEEILAIRLRPTHQRLVNWPHTAILLSEKSFISQIVLLELGLKVVSRAQVVENRAIRLRHTHQTVVNAHQIIGRQSLWRVIA